MTILDRVSCLQAKSFQSCPTLCDPMDCSPPASSVHGILQATILRWLPCPPPGNLPNPEIKPRSSALQADSLPFELSGKPMELIESMKNTYIDHQIYFNLLFNFKLFGYLQSFRWSLIGPTIVHLFEPFV